MTLSLLSLALLVGAAHGHGNIMEPAAQWQKGYPDTGFSSTVESTLWGKIDGQKYGYGGEGALKYFDANFKTSEYKSLRDLILAKQKVEPPGTAECGFTIKVDSKRVALTPTLTHSSFFHPGPCEVWCDNQKLAYALDCQTAYPNSKIPLDTSKCSGADRLTLYWLAVHGSPWQVYIDCVYLTGSKGGSGESPSSPATPPAAGPSPTTKAPAPQTPTITTKTPALTPPAQAPTPAPVAGEASTVPQPTTKSPPKGCRKRERQ